jgi:hypothetical protein
VSVAQKEDDEESIDEQDVFDGVVLFPGYNGFCGSCSTPFIEPETSKFSSQLSA